MIDRYVAHTSCILESCCHIINHTEQANTQNMINHYQDLLLRIEIDTVYINDLVGASKHFVFRTPVTIYSLFSSEGYLHHSDNDHQEAGPSASQLNP